MLCANSTAPTKPHDLVDVTIVERVEEISIQMFTHSAMPTFAISSSTSPR
jgi:hypothetical protein